MPAPLKGFLGGYRVGKMSGLRSYCRNCVDKRRKVGPDLGRPGRLQLVEHRLDPVEGFFQICDPPLFDVSEAALDGSAKLGPSSFDLAGLGNGIVVGARVRLGKVVHVSGLYHRRKNMQNP